MTHCRLLPATVPVPDGLRCHYWLVDPTQSAALTALVVSFAGEVPDGSRGNPHGRYISTAALHGLHAFDADCVILDFRELGYRWGNSLLQVFQDIAQFMDADAEPDEPPFPMAVVTSQRCRDGFLSLVTPVGGEPPEMHFDDIDAAVAHALRKAREWLDF